MPIPRHAEKEFFIPEYNRLIYGNNNTNEAIIYDPDESFSFFTFPFHPISFNSEQRSVFNRLFLIPSSRFVFIDLDLPLLRRNDRDEFILKMSEIYDETVNNRDHSEQFRNCLNEFLRKHDNCYDLCILCREFISDIPLNNDIQNLLGNELINVFQEKVSVFYKKLEKKKERMKRKSLHMQFKEFKTHKSYSEKRINYQMKNKIINKKWNIKSTHRKMKMILLINF